VCEKRCALQWSFGVRCSIWRSPIRAGVRCVLFATWPMQRSVISLFHSCSTHVLQLFSCSRFLQLFNAWVALVQPVSQLFTSPLPDSLSLGMSLCAVYADVCQSIGCATQNGKKKES